MKPKKNYFGAWIACIITAVAAVVFSLLTLRMDVQPAGLEGTEIGFAGFNTSVAAVLPFRPFWYYLTQLLGYLAILGMVFFFTVGLLQLIKRKKVFAVNAGILLMGVVYALLFVIYVAFEIKAVNYRPVLMPGKTELEASFPSSHAMLACVVFLTGGIQLNRTIKNPKTQSTVTIVSVLLTALTVVGRLLSGAHWITDICAGCLISLTLVLFYMAVSGPALALQKRKHREGRI